MAFLELIDIDKSFGKNNVISKFNLQVEKGKFLVLLGPSGCGKSTLLRMLAGLEKIDKGKIILENKLLNDLLPSKRKIAMVFQSYALYPHMNVSQNNQVSNGPIEVSGASDEFKTYKLTWSQDELSAEVIIDDNGNTVSTLYHENDENGSEFWPFDQDFFILLNLAVGGNMGGEVIDNSAFPQDLKIDYVRVSQRGCNE